MANPLSYFTQRLGQDWLIGADSNQFAELTQQRFQELKERDSETPTVILLTEPNPVKFLAEFIAACAAGCPVFLGNPTWTAAEWQQVLAIVQPDLLWGSGLVSADFPPISLSVRGSGDRLAPGLIMIPTGGSSGQIRFVMHTWETLMASVQGFRSYFQVDQVHSCCVLPLYHVSGLMQFLRSFTSGGKLCLLPFKALEAGAKPQIEPHEFFLSLVPTQLYRLLQTPDMVSWLTQFQAVLLGGAPAWKELLEQARCDRIPLAPTYGMTETASQIATLTPEAFLKGHDSCGQALPHARITICDAQNHPLKANQIGRITVQSASLALGYYPKAFHHQTLFQPDDLGFFDDKNELQIVGRNSNKIITGGENVFPEEIEAVICATQLVEDVCVVGVSDQHWGEAVMALYVPKKQAFSLELLQLKIQAKLSKFKQPKQWILIEEIPRNAQGKINREQLRQIAIRKISANA